MANIKWFAVWCDEFSVSKERTRHRARDLRFPRLARHRNRYPRFPRNFHARSSSVTAASVDGKRWIATRPTPTRHSKTRSRGSTTRAIIEIIKFFSFFFLDLELEFDSRIIRGVRPSKDGPPWEGTWGFVKMMKSWEEVLEFSVKRKKRNFLARELYFYNLYKFIRLDGLQIIERERRASMIFFFYWNLKIRARDTLFESLKLRDS